MSPEEIGEELTGTQMKAVDLFSGIGGLSLAGSRAGIETIQFCEIEPFCQAVLKKNFPGVPIHADVRTFDGQSFRGRVDFLWGGFPCQDISGAGKGAGIVEGKRSSLWFEFLRIIGEIRPTICLIENVPALRNRGADVVLQGLEEAGYSAEAFVVGADDLGATHRRKRVWIVAYSRHGAGRGERLTGGRGDAQGERAADHGAPAGPSSEMADADEAGRGERGRREPREAELPSSECGSATVADASPQYRGGQEQTASLYSRSSATVADAEGGQNNFGERRCVAGEKGCGKGGDNAPCVSCQSMADAEGVGRGQYTHPGEERHEGRENTVASGLPAFPPGPEADWSGIPQEFWPVESRVCVLADGVPPELVRRRRDAGKRAAILKSLGNAVVPAVAEAIIKSILATFPERLVLKEK